MIGDVGLPPPPTPNPPRAKEKWPGRNCEAADPLAGLCFTSQKPTLLLLKAFLAVRSENKSHLGTNVEQKDFIKVLRIIHFIRQFTAGSSRRGSDLLQGKKYLSFIPKTNNSALRLSVRVQWKDQHARVLPPPPNRDATLVDIHDARCRSLPPPHTRLAVGPKWLNQLS